MNHQSSRVEHTYEVISTLQAILAGLTDVQGAVRGYLISESEDYLAPYHLALPSIESNMDKLQKLVADNPEQYERSRTLDLHVGQRLAIAANTIETYKKDGQESAFEIVRQGIGKREMDTIRTIIADMTSSESSLLDLRRVSVGDFTRLTLYAGTTGVAICLAILMSVFYLIHREFRARASTEASLRDAASVMERHNTETKLVSQMGDYLRSCRERQEVYDVIAENMPRLFPQSFGSISVFNKARTSLSPAMTWGDLPKNAEQEFGAEDCWALRQGRGHLAYEGNSAPVCNHLKNVDRCNVSFCLPMQAQGETIGQIYFGALAAEAKHVGKHEMGTMRRIAEQISLALANLDLQQALREQSIRDALTKLHNRRYLEETLPREMSRMERNGKTLGLMIMDIDHFKKVNDTYGHDGGDAVLTAFAALLERKVRKEDMACRLGGEEFVLVFPDIDKEFAADRAEEIRAETRKISVKHGGQIIQVSVSIGVALYSAGPEGADALIARADQCLYRAKNGGRDRVVIDEDIAA